MYLEKDYYLPERRLNLKDDAEVVAFIKKSFPDAVPYTTQGTYIGFWIRFFSHACYPVTRPAVSSVLGSYVGSSKVKIKLSRYLDVNKLSEVKFKTKDMGAAKAFYLPKNEQDSFAPHLPEFMRDMVKVRRTGGTVPGHDYGMGLSILNMMLIQKPFAYGKEVNFSLVHYKKGRGALCVDAIIQFKDEDFTIYLEQDMGTEKIGELVGKLFLYEKHGLCGRRSFVVFSSHEMKTYPSCKSFSIKDLKALVREMGLLGAHNLDSYYELFYISAEEPMKETFRAIAVRTGYLLAYNEGIRLDATEIDADTPLVINKQTEPFTLDELRRYIKELECGNNPYRLRLYNKEQSHVANYKFRRMCEILSTLIRQGTFNAGEVRAVLDDGLSCLVYPTTLLSRCYDYIKFSCKEWVVSSLKKYYPAIVDAKYTASSPIIQMDGDIPNIILRNCFTLPDGKIICVEHIGKDAGAFARFYYLNLYKNEIRTPVHVIGLVENSSEISFFANISSYRAPMPKIYDKNFFASFLLHNTNDSDKLLLPVGYDNEYEILSIL